MVEAVTGETWEQVLSTRLFVPLGIDLGNDPADFIGSPTGDTDPWGHGGNDQVPCDPGTGLCDFFAFGAPAGLFSGKVAALAKYLAWHIQCHTDTIPANDPSRSLLSTEACRELHEPADASVSNYGYGWECYGLFCTHDGTNGLNYMNVTLDFGVQRAYVAFTNGDGRSGNLDAKMVAEAVQFMMRDGDDETAECTTRFPSTAYLDTETLPPTPSPTASTPTLRNPALVVEPTPGPTMTTDPPSTSKPTVVNTTPTLDATRVETSQGGSSNSLLWIFTTLVVLLLFG